MIEPDKQLGADALLEVLALADAAMAVYSSEELHIIFANDAMLRLWGKPRDIIGKTLAEGVPELVDQPFIGLLQNVWRSGKTYIGTEIPGKLLINSAVTTAYFDFEYRAIIGQNGKTYSIIHTATDVTARVNYKALAKEKGERERQLYGELSAANLELQMLNEELTSTNEELLSLNEENSTLNEELSVSNEELQSLNHEYVALNESANRNLESAHLAKEAASLGMFDLDVVNDKLDWDDRCKELFGLKPAANVTYTNDFVKGLHRDDRARVEQAVADAYNYDLTGGKYDVAFRTVGAEDKKLRWVRAIGSVNFNEDKKPLRFIGSVIDITEQKEDDQRKNDFIGMVSHELKTPLTSLSAYLQVLQGKASKTEDAFVINALDKSNAQVKKMTTMINGFLNVSRLESGKIFIDRKRFDMATLLAGVEEEAHTTTSSHQITFAACEPVMVYADEDKIGQVINNFISNAVKYSAPGTTIEVACAAAGGNVKVSVTDQGMGIDKQNLKKLFDRFYRVEGAHTETISGFGIGLYLCAQIIERHNGKIGVESELGYGSTFWFTIPGR